MGTLEALGRARTGKLYSFSEQQLIDCSANYGNRGCSGGLISAALRYTQEHGVTLESSYPYTGSTDSCKPFAARLANVGQDEAHGCTDIKAALLHRPVAVKVDASHWSSYSSGVFSNCGNKVNHAILLVGATEGFWKAKNSWGSGWGERGFIRLAPGSTCGVCLEGHYPL